jgi:hypothetical protein
MPNTRKMNKLESEKFPANILFRRTGTVHHEKRRGRIENGGRSLPGAAVKASCSALQSKEYEHIFPASKRLQYELDRHGGNVF